MQKTKRILEIGYGGRPIIGELGKFIKEFPGGIEYHGIDLLEINAKGKNGVSRIFERAHEEAMRMALPDRMKIYNRDARRLNQEEFQGYSFDEIHMHFVHTYPRIKADDTLKMISEIDRLLSREGVVFISGERESGMINRIVRGIMHIRMEMPNDFVEREMKKLGYFTWKVTSQNKTDEAALKRSTDQMLDSVFGIAALKNAFGNEEWATDIEFMIFKRKE